MGYPKKGDRILRQGIPPLADGKPISSKDFVERMFGEWPALFKDDHELRRIWSDPDTRKALLEQLADRGYDSTVFKQVRHAIMAEDSGRFDVQNISPMRPNRRPGSSAPTLARKRSRSTTTTSLLCS